jgi:hypothetical protein
MGWTSGRTGKRASCNVSIVVFIRYRGDIVTGLCLAADVTECYLCERLPQWHRIIWRGWRETLTDRIIVGSGISVGIYTTTETPLQEISFPSVMKHIPFDCSFLI